MPPSNPDLRIAVLPPDVRHWVTDAVAAGGGTIVDLADAEALVWTASGFEPGFRPEDLTSVLADHPAIRWIQLPFAGVEPYAAAGVFDDSHTWTCGKGVYARPVAEHALALVLAGFHHLKQYSEARTWTGQAGANLNEGRVTIFGGGGITEELVGLLQPFRCHVTVVRKHPSAMAGVDEVVGWDDRVRAVDGAAAVFLALALTPETEGFFDRSLFEPMSDSGWLVNVARGRHVVTDDLVVALREGVIGGAGLDVTEPEPLPDDHPLWQLPNCLITPHTANTLAMAIPLLSARIAENIRRYARNEQLLGLVVPALGY